MDKENASILVNYKKLEQELLKPFIQQVSDFINCSMATVDNQEVEGVKIPCFECSKETDHYHHVVPRSRGGTKMVPLCADCHGKAHGHKISARALTLLGLEKAKARGVILGRPKKHNYEEIKQYRKMKYTYSEIKKFMPGVPTATIARACRELKESK